MDVAATTDSWPPGISEPPTQERPKTLYKSAPAAGPVPATGSFGRYVLLGECKAGGMGVVYKAQDTALDRVVALKMIKTGGLAGPAEVSRFQREARAVARLKHPHIVAIHDVAQEQGLHYLTMQYLGGGSLSQHLDRFHKNTRATAALIEKVARAVHHAHEHNILHRDLKPANILLDEADEPHVTDFGLVKFLEGPALAGREAAVGAGPDKGAPPDGNGQSPGTDPQTVGAVGTPPYMSPEQLTGAEVARSTDVWALGVMLYRLLTGKQPFAGPTHGVLAEQIVGEAPLRPRQLRPGLDPALEAICLRCLEKDPARRYPSAAALADDLARWRHTPWPVRLWRFVRRRPLAAAAVVLLLGATLAAALVLVQPSDPDQPLHAIRNELARGKAVTLVGATGPPAWLRWQVGGKAAQVVPTTDQTFTVTTWSFAVLELLSEPPCKSYRFSAEVAERDVVGGATGLYVGHHAVDTGRTVLHWLADWSYVERAAHDEEPALIGLRLRCCEARPFIETDANANLSGSCLDHRDHGAGLGTWRRLAVELTPGEVRLYWQGQRVQGPGGKLIQLSERVQIFRETYWHHLEELGFPPTNPDPACDVRGGLGFYIDHCSASFRNVILEPLASGD